MSTRILDELAELVSTESPSNDSAAVTRCAELTSQIGAGWLGRGAETIVRDGRPHLRWSFSEHTDVLVLGHFDTVWPAGTIDRWPFNVSGDCATGPGVFDMKAGVIEAFLALGRLDDLDGITVLLTSDEEIGSPSSRGLIEQCARGAKATLVLEPSADGALKTARKGVSLYDVEFSGRAAHAGLEPETGINAVTALAHWTVAATALADPGQGTTVTPTMIGGGTAINTVPRSARLGVDVRVSTQQEQTRIDDAFHAIAVPVDGVGIEFSGGPNRPPLELARAKRLFALADEIAVGLGHQALREVHVGGGSDGNFTAGLGVDTLDGLGAVGAHAHAEGEWASLTALTERADLVRELIKRVVAQ
jgi:glutamate carboxypeptidase